MTTVNTLTPAAESITDSLLSKVTLCARLAVSARTIENMVKAGDFPPGERIGKFLYWSEVSVSAWQQRRFGAQQSWRPRVTPTPS